MTETTLIARGPYLDGPPPAPWVAVAALVTRQAALTPDATAVVEGGRELTYRELDARANQLAHYLRSRAVGRESLVGVCLYRGYDLAVALLAVWRAGAAYVPLTPDLPARRVAKLLDGAGVALVLTETESAGMVKAAGADPVILDAVAADLAGLPTTPPAPGAGPDNAACVIHTSGSTGEPKAVVLTHRGLANRIDWSVRTWKLSPRDRVLQKTPVSFDAHIWEVFAPLTCGATLVMATPWLETDPEALVDELAAQRATVLQVVPSLLRRLVEAPGWDDCTELRLVVSAGEPLHYELAQRVFALAEVELWNTYGPTECSIDVTAHRVDRGPTTGPVPIGRPLQGTRLLIVGPDGRPVPDGRPGELLAGGVAVGRGYHRSPLLTAERFILDPWQEDGERLYRTGDLVRRRPDGELEFLDRLDAQIKVDGVRIEPGEIEIALRGHPAVQDALVTVFPEPDGTRKLAAYIISVNGAHPAQLRPYLARLLPASHIPTAFIEVEDLPGEPGGIRVVSGSPARERRVPLSPVERLVAEAWQEVLGGGEPGLDDDFFHREGTSLQLTLLAALLRESSGIDFEPGLLFQATTVRAQAELLAALRDG